jgi:signal transduction histidine kinase
MATTTHPGIVSLLTNARVQAIFAIFALCAVTLFVYSLFAFRPYDGMSFGLAGGTSDALSVGTVHVKGPAEDAGILVGDEILSIDGQVVDAWGNRPSYRAYIRPGDSVVYRIRRNDQSLTLSATMGSYRDNLPLLSQLAGHIFLSFCFWSVGVVLSLFTPPDDVRARLVGLMWLLGAIAMAAGGPGTYSQFWGAYTTMEVAWCLLGLVFVAAHLYFPVPSFVAHRKRIIYTLATIAIVLSALIVVNEWFLNPQGLDLPHFAGFGVYDLLYIFFLLSVLASVGLLLRNRFLSKDTDAKRQITIVLWGTLLGFVPFFIFDLIPTILFERRYGGYFAILFFVLIPLAYVYVIYQRKLLRIDFFINRTVVFFVLLMFVLTVSTLIMGLIALALGLPLELLLTGGVVTALIALPSWQLREQVQMRVNKVLYGYHYDLPSVTSTFASRLARTLDKDKLVELLTRDLVKQMGIQRSTLLLSAGDVLREQNPVSEDSEPHTVAIDDELCQLLVEHKLPVRVPQMQQLFSPNAQDGWERLASWVRLFVPLVFEGRLVGLFMLSERSTGDVYGDDDVHLIATIAQQAALAYTNVQLVERLRGLNRMLVRGDETHRKRVARQLHDTALQQLFFAKERLLDTAGSEKLVDLLDDTISALRGMIKEARPPLLDQGLLLALQGVVEDMQKVVGPWPAISLTSDLGQIGELAFTDERATALYRIAQESITNAIKHAQASNITISLTAEQDGSVRLSIEDDGIGMSSPGPLAGTGEHHYGLMGMQERAAMIGAHLKIISAPGEGTCVQVEVRI